jgi:hypothetical protein
VLPKNIWLYVAQIPNLAKLGKKFVLQGGTQRNLAAVKSQVDFISSRFRVNGDGPEIIIHEHCGESGAIGAGLEAARLYENGAGPPSSVSTPCRPSRTPRPPPKTRAATSARTIACAPSSMWKPRACIKRDQGEVDTASATAGARKSKVPLGAGARRLIVNNSCEKGLVEDVESNARDQEGPRCAAESRAKLSSKRALRDVFKSFKPEHGRRSTPKHAFTAGRRPCRADEEARELPHRIPRMSEPVFDQSAVLGVLRIARLSAPTISSTPTTPPKSCTRKAPSAAIDPCFPSKLGIPHVHNLIFKHHEKKPLDAIFFPMIDDLKSELQDSGLPRLSDRHRHAGSGEGRVHQGRRLFAKKGIQYLCPVVNVAQPLLFSRQMFAAWKDLLGLSEKENERAVEAGSRRSTSTSTRRDATRARCSRARAREQDRHRGARASVPQRPRHQPRDPGSSSRSSVIPVFTPGFAAHRRGYPRPPLWRRSARR